MAAWRATGAIESLPQIDVQELRERVEAGAVDVLDVRQPAEWAAGHIPGATFVTGAELPSRIDEVPDRRPVAVVCATGYRSSVAASLLAPHRPRGVLNVLGGMTAWDAAGHPVDQPESAPRARIRGGAR